MSRTVLSPQELSLFCQQVELLLSSGLPLHDGMPTLASHYAGTPAEAAMKAMAQQVFETGSLALGVKDCPLFPTYLKEMVRIGELTGQLETVLHGLSGYYDREDSIRKAVRNALTYPLVLIVMMAGVIGLLIAKVLPIFRDVLGGLGEPTLEGSKLLQLGSALGTGVLVVAGLVLVVAVGLLLWHRLAPQQADRCFVRLFPVYRHLQEKLAAARFAGLMEMLLSGGFPLSECLSLMEGVFSGEAVARIQRMREAVENGTPFAQAVEDSGIFAPLYGKMIRLGFDAGRSEEVMGKLCTVYETDLDEQLTRLVNLIEPTLVTILSLIIGAILLSVMLPLASILTGIA